MTEWPWPGIHVMRNIKGMIEKGVDDVRTGQYHNRAVFTNGNFQAEMTVRFNDNETTLYIMIQI